MSDPVRTERDRTPPRRSPGPSTSFLRRLAGQILDSDSGSGSNPPVAPLDEIGQIRIDGPHVPVADQATGGATVSRENQPEAARSDQPPTASFSRREEEVLRETSQIAAHLRTERHELERREQALQEQHALLDKEWRSARLWVHEFEEEMLKRQSDFKARENELKEKIGACETLVGELEEQERLVFGLRDQMSTERANLRTVVDRELEIERLALQQTRLALDEERRSLAEELEKRRRENDEYSRAVQVQLDAERAAIRSQLYQELDAERAAFEHERAAWNERRTTEEQQLRDRHEIAQTASQRAQEELHSLRRREFDELRLQREAIDAEVAARGQAVAQERQKLETDRQRFSDDLAELKKLQMEEIDRERQRVREEIETGRQELDAVRSRIEDDLKRRVEERERGLREEQKKLEDQHREQLARLEQERNLLENRIRFQQEHLQKARQEVEAAQQELRRQHQVDRVEFETREENVRLRDQQVAHVRSLLDEREQSLAREHALIAERRRAIEKELELQSASLSRDRVAWEEDRATRETELCRRDETLTADGERLESRRQRLDGLRIELEDTHRKTLEMRMAIEEVWAQLSTQTGTDAAKRRLAETQRLLEEDWQQVRESIARERRELAELQASIAAERAELDREKREAVRIADERQASFDLRQRQLADEQAALRARETDLNGLREQWIDEKIEVEHIIRGLLTQVGQQPGQTSSDDNSAALPG